MRRRRLIKRLISLALAVAMMVPAFSAVAEAAIATWLAPKPGESIASRNVEVAVGFNTQSDLKVTRLELWVDGRFYTKKVLVKPESRGVCSFWWDTTRTPQGSHSLAVKLFAGDDLISTVSGTATVGEVGYDLRPPTVRFTNIKTGDVLKGTTNIKLEAHDDSGEPPIVSLLVDNALKLLTNRPPYNFDLDTSQYTDGNHELLTYAYDTAGNKSDPAVVTVQFRNNLERPVLASIQVDPSPAKVPPSEEDFKPIAPIPAEPKPDAASAARAAEPGVTAWNSGRATGPVAAVEPKRSPAPVAKPRLESSGAKAAPIRSAGANAVRDGGTAPIRAAEPALPGAPEKSIAPPASARPVQMAANVPQMEVRKSGAPAVSDARPAQPAKPPASESARASAPAPGSSTGAPRVKAVEHSSEPAKGTAARPESAEQPRASKPTRVAMAPDSVLRGVDHTGSARETRAAVPETGREAVSARAESVSEGAAPGSIRPADVSQGAPAARSAAVRPAAAAAKSEPKPVAVAMLPSIKTDGYAGSCHGVVACPPQVKKDTQAKLEEKATVPVSGSVKLRDIFDKLGGVLFWDPATHTVTAYAGDIVLEMQIGSRLVKVNGREMRVDKAPSIANGRTVIDARVYHQARAFAASGGVAKAE